jgi:hypothetical protein
MQDAVFVLDESKLQARNMVASFIRHFTIINRISIGLSPKLQLLNNAIRIRDGLCVCSRANRQTDK